MKYVFTPNKDGFIPKRVKESIAQEFKAMAGKKIQVVIGKYVNERSNDQLRYWFSGIVKPFALHFGYDLEEAHIILKDICDWVDVVAYPNGEEKRVVRSINKNEKGEKSTTTDLMWLIEVAIRKCAEEGLIIETPEEYYSKNPNQEDFIDETKT